MMKVKVACRVVNGITIRRSKQGYDDGTGDGVKTMIHDGAPVTLRGPSSLHTGAGATQRDDLDPVENEVDAEWMAGWFAQNQNASIVTDKYIEQIGEPYEVEG